MAVSAAIKFTQGESTAPAGEAMFGSLGSPVEVSNGNNSGATAWEWTLLDAPPDSALVPGVVLSGATPTYSFTPDVTGCYLLKLRVTDASGNAAEDVRALGVPEESGRLIPPYKGDGAALNFGGNARGWSTYLEEYLRYVDSIVGTAGANAFTQTIDGFTQPAQNNSVNVRVEDGSWVAPGQVLYVQDAGYFTAGTPYQTGPDWYVPITNLGYAGNASGGSSIGDGKDVSPAGLRGVQGTQGNAGAAGKNAYSLTAADYVQPAANANVSVALPDGTAWPAVGQVVYVAGGGHYEVIDGPSFGIVPPDTVVALFTFKRLGYATDETTGVTVSSGASVSPAGLSGSSGLFLTPSGGVVITSPASGNTLDATLYTNDTGGPVVISGLLHTITQTLLGTGVVTLTVGLAGGGVEFVTAQSISSATAAGVIGAWQAQLGARFPSNQDYNAVLANGESLVMRLVCDGGTVTRSFILRVKVLGVAA